MSKVANQIGGDVTYCPRKDGKRGSIFSLRVPVAKGNGDEELGSGGEADTPYLKSKARRQSENGVAPAKVELKETAILVVEDNIICLLYTSRCV